MFRRFMRNESGATAIEYGILATVLSLAIIGGVGLLAGEMEIMWTETGDAVTGSIN